MPRSPRDGPASGAWQWSRTAQTQRVLLDAARQVFAERGFTEASIADIVQRAGSSVGSLYHHFGGKSELFIALWQEDQLAHEEAAGQAAAEARKQGVTDPALLFASGDAPPGFEVLRRQRSREWIGQSDSLLYLTDVPQDRVYAAILTSLIGEGSYEVAGARNRRQAETIIDAVIEYARRLTAGGRPPRD